MPPSSPLSVVERNAPATAGSVVVALVHGTADRSTSFASLARALGDVPTLAWDRRGYARSRAVPAAASLDDHVADLADLLDGRPAVVLGHSFGGCVALRAAERLPGQVLGLVVWEAPLAWLPWWPTEGTGAGLALAAPTPEAAVEAFLRRVLGDQRFEALPPRAWADRLAEAPALLSDLRSIRAEPGAAPPVDLAAVTQPVVVGHGTASRPHQLDGSRRLAGLLADAELAAVEGAAHGAHASHPAEVAGLVRRVLARVADDGGPPA